MQGGSFLVGWQSVCLLWEGGGVKLRAKYTISIYTRQSQYGNLLYHTWNKSRYNEDIHYNIYLKPHKKTHKVELNSGFNTNSNIHTSKHTFYRSSVAWFTLNHSRAAWLNVRGEVAAVCLLVGGPPVQPVSRAGGDNTMCIRRNTYNKSTSAGFRLPCCCTAPKEFSFNTCLLLLTVALTTNPCMLWVYSQKLSSQCVWCYVNQHLAHTTFTIKH